MVSVLNDIWSKFNRCEVGCNVFTLESRYKICKEIDFSQILKLNWSGFSSRFFFAEVNLVLIKQCYARSYCCRHTLFWEPNRAGTKPRLSLEELKAQVSIKEKLNEKIQFWVD